MARPKSANSILKSFKKQQFEPKTPIATDMYLPNHSGDHSKGLVRTTPTQETEIPNKKYVDDAIDTDITTHIAITDAHHAKYTDAEAVSAVATDDAYLKNTGDTGTGDYTLDGSVTINEAGASKDFRVETLNNPNMIFVDGSEDKLHLNSDNTSLTGTANFNLYGDGPKLAMIDDTNGIHYGFGSAGGIFQVTQVTNNGESATGAGQFFAMDTSKVIINRSKANIDFTVNGDTTADLFYVDAGTELTTIGGKTLGLAIAKDGDTFWTGDGSGLPYGSFSSADTDINWTQAAAVQNTWYDISDADIATGQLNLVTHDGSGQLTVTKAGRYLINYSVAFETDAGNTHIETAINVTGTEATNGMGHVEAVSSNAEHTISSTAILDLATNATIHLAIRTTDNTTPDITVEFIDLTLIQVGGT